MQAEPTKAARAGALLKRAWPLLAIAAALVLVFSLGLHRYLSFAVLRDNRADLVAWVAAMGPLAVLAFIAAYIVVVTLSLPGGAVMTIAGGFLFGAVWGSLWVVIGATIGASLLFLAARTSLGEPLRARAGPALARMAEGFRANAFSYLLFLRLVPAFPFFLVNLAPAFLGVPLGTYVLATFLGIVPATFVFASVGAGLGSVFDAGGDFTPVGILTPQVLLALGGLALLSLLPIALKRFSATRKD
jgi:uncharacterized membrane protein YdjX (TVP38/TMEM64 family)